MAVPSFAGPYADQLNQVIDTAVAFDITAGWTGADSFEVNTLPPGFTFDGTNLGGVNRSLMDYTIFIRGVNADGAADWEPLHWTTAGAPATERVLWGLSLEYQTVNPLGTASILYIETATRTGRQSTWNAGLMFVNDVGDSIDRDGTSARYDSSWVGSQILLSGGADTLVRASVPGWEIIIDPS